MHRAVEHNGDGVYLFIIRLIATQDKITRHQISVPFYPNKLNSVQLLLLLEFSTEHRGCFRAKRTKSIGSIEETCPLMIHIHKNQFEMS